MCPFRQRSLRLGHLRVGSIIRFGPQRPPRRGARRLRRWTRQLLCGVDRPANLAGPRNHRSWRDHPRHAALTRTYWTTNPATQKSEERSAALAATKARLTASRRRLRFGPSAVAFGLPLNEFAHGAQILTVCSAELLSFALFVPLRCFQNRGKSAVVVLRWRCAE